MADAITRPATTTRPSLARTAAAGLAGGITSVLGAFITFGQLGGSQPGEQGLLFDPDTQHPKVITVWKELEPLPRIIETPALILGGLLVFGLCYALLYRSIAAGWAPGLHHRAWRLAPAIWLAAAFSEFMGPFNVLHQSALLSLLGWSFWAVPAVAAAYTIVFIADRGGRRNRPLW